MNKFSKTFLCTEPNVVYIQKLGDDNEKLPNKTCIIVQLNILKDKLKDHHCVVFVHKSQVNPTKSSHW